MKCCRRCGVDKEVSEFNANHRYKDGYGSWCKQCHRNRNSSWFKENKKRLTDKAYKWRAENIDKAREIDRAFKKRNKEKLATLHAEWAKKNRDKRNATCSKRRASKINATPVWADFEAIKAIYRQAAVWQTITGQRLHVDHIIPLQGITVCGLHCESNLRIIEGSINESKRNKLIEETYDQPDMFVEQPAKMVQESLL